MFYLQLSCACVLPAWWCSGEWPPSSFTSTAVSAAASELSLWWDAWLWLLWWLWGLLWQHVQPPEWQHVWGHVWEQHVWRIWTQSHGTELWNKWICSDGWGKLSTGFSIHWKHSAGSGFCCNDAGVNISCCIQFIPGSHWSCRSLLSHEDPLCSDILCTGSNTKPEVVVS